MRLSNKRVSKGALTRALKQASFRAWQQATNGGFLIMLRHPSFGEIALAAASGKPRPKPTWVRNPNWQQFIHQEISI